MMDEMYGFQTDYSAMPPPPQPPANMMYFSPDYNNAHTISFHDRGGPLLYGSSEPPPFFSPSSVVSESRGSEEEVSSAMRVKISSHPLYPKLLEAYLDCQKVGAPPEIAHVLDEISRESDFSGRCTVTRLGADPELDEFMETYCDLLTKYKEDLERPFEEATSFLNNIETQLNNLCNYHGSSTSRLSDDAAVSSEEDISGGESAEMMDFQRHCEDQDLKDKLLRKYSGYLTSLKHEFSKKKKKGKLPKEARQMLLDWWNIHYKWPYPTESDKVALAESTGLDQKQINNWFINQRKRHWKPSENIQFGVMDSLYGPFFTSD